MNDEDVQLLREQIERLQHLVDKLADNTGWDISELIEDGYLLEGDMD